MTKLIKGTLSAAMVGGFLLASNAIATPITFQMTVPNASGSNNGAAFTNQTVVITVQADTVQVTGPYDIGGSGAPGNCVLAQSTSISVGGGAALQVAAPVYFCSAFTAYVTGIFTTPNAANNSWYFVADYSNAGITNFALASNFPLTANVPDDTAITTTALNLAGGGTASLTTVPLSGTTFAAALGAPTAATPVPTMGEYALFALAMMLAMAGMATFRRRQRA